MDKCRPVTQRVLKSGRSVLCSQDVFSKLDNVAGIHAILQDTSLDMSR